MAATVEIKTGSRRILGFIFSPLVEIGESAMRERRGRRRPPHAWRPSRRPREIPLFRLRRRRRSLK